jgi:hypothetical protein
MKVKAFSALAGLGSALIAASPAAAGFTGITTEGKPNPFGLLVCNVFASFDRPGHDSFLSAAGTPDSPMDISVIGGTFYQHPDGGFVPPSAAAVQAFPSLAFDSFVTIGVKMVGQPGGQPYNSLVLTDGFGYYPFSLWNDAFLGGDGIGWAVTPSDPQSDPFNPAYVNGDGQVLIGQFTTLDGTGIAGMFRILVVSNNVATQLNVSFFHVPGPGAVVLLAASGLAGSRRRKRAR